MSRSKKKKLNLALQGGGAHGAFTWGVLDKFLELDCFTIEGVSATSAGSMNGVVLAQGMMQGGNECARELLHQFWQAMSKYGKLFNPYTSLPIDLVIEQYLKMPFSFALFNAMTNVLSPYEFNPMNFHPIREVLEDMLEIDKLRKQSKIKLFVCATSVETGKIKVFDKNELSVDVILASACLPKLFQAVKIGDDHYWDGGYLGDPAIFPLIYYTNSIDILILHVVPIVREEIPTTAMEIDTRLREISFNSSLMREMRAIAFVTKLIDEGWIKKEYKTKLKRMNVHCLRADDIMKEFSLASVFNPDWNFLLKLRDLGRKAGEAWVNANFQDIGVKGTVNFDEWL